jgi:hypothetical protein
MIRASSGPSSPRCRSYTLVLECPVIQGDYVRVVPGFLHHADFALCAAVDDGAGAHALLDPYSFILLVSDDDYAAIVIATCALGCDGDGLVFTSYRHGFWSSGYFGVWL